MRRPHVEALRSHGHATVQISSGGVPDFSSASTSSYSTAIRSLLEQAAGDDRGHNAVSVEGEPRRRRVITKPDDRDARTGTGLVVVRLYRCCVTHRIVVNQTRCRCCGDTITSRSRHDFRSSRAAGFASMVAGATCAASVISRTWRSCRSSRQRGGAMAVSFGLRRTPPGSRSGRPARRGSGGTPRTAMWSCTSLTGVRPGGGVRRRAHRPAALAARLDGVAVRVGARVQQHPGTAANLVRCTDRATQQQRSGGSPSTGVIAAARSALRTSRAPTCLPEPAPARCRGGGRPARDG
jgi:hypothetical protein